ncbi:MAG: YeeE/YedE family protein [Byssovorax sp.]
MMPSSLVWGAVGGALIGLSASLLLLSHGKIAGVSGMLGGLLDPKATDRGYRAWFLAGLLLVGLVFRLVRPEMLAPAHTTSIGLTAAAGLIVGFGTSLGNGCTSGHGVCGVSRLSIRSIIATATFIVTGAVTVFITDHVLGGGQ